MAANEPTMPDAALTDDSASHGPWANAWKPVWDDPPAPGATSDETRGFGTSAEASAESHDTVGDYGSA